MSGLGSARVIRLFEEMEPREHEQGCGAEASTSAQCRDTFLSSIG